MLSQGLFFRDVLANPGALRFVLNALAVGETDGGRDLALVADRCDVPELREKIRKHHRDEVRHGELYEEVLRRLGEETSPLPADLDYEAAIRRAGIGLSPERLREPRPLDGSEYVALFACMRVTEERAWSNTRMLRDGFSSDATLHACAERVLRDETWHRAYATKEIERLASNGRRTEVRRLLRTYRRKEAWAYLSVTLAYIDRICELLRYGSGRRLLMKLGCVGAYLWTIVTPAPALKRLAPLLLAVLPLLAARHARADDPNISVRYRADTLSVRLHDTPLRDVLALVAQQSGATVRGEITSPRNVTTSFDDVPLNDALHRLAGRQGFILKYAGGQLRSIELVSPGTAPAATVRATPGADPSSAHDSIMATLFPWQADVRLPGRLARALHARTLSLGRVTQVALLDENPKTRRLAMRVAMRHIEQSFTARMAIAGATAVLDDRATAALVQRFCGNRAEEVLTNAAAALRDPSLHDRALSVRSALGSLES